MQTFNKPGQVVTYTAPAGGVLSGLGYLVGSLLVIATGDAAEGDQFEGAVVGIFDVPKDGAEEWAEGDKVYFDENSTPPVFNVAATGPLVGVSVVDIAASPANEVGRVRLDGVAR